jgi:hypothetical protein
MACLDRSHPPVHIVGMELNLNHLPDDEIRVCPPHSYAFSRPSQTNKRPFSGPHTPVLVSYWFAGLIYGC